MDLNINFQETRTLANNIKNQAEEFNSKLSKVNEINEDLKSAWEGTDAASYSNEVANQAKIMKDLYNTISSISNFLTSVANAYEEVSRNNTIK